MRDLKAETMSIYISSLLCLSLTQTLKLGWCLINICWVKIFLWTFRRIWGQITHHWKELEACSTGPGHYLHGFDVHSTLVPPELSLVLPTSLIFLVFDGFHYVLMTVHCLYTCFLGTITITIFSFCTTAAILSVSKLIFLIIISLPFWTKVENFCLQTPGGNLHLDVVSIWN